MIVFIPASPTKNWFSSPIESACCDLQCTLELLQFNCMCWAKKERERYFCLTPCTPFFCFLDLGFHCSVEKTVAQMQRDAKEIHFAVSGTQILKVEMVFRVICTTQVFWGFFCLFLILFHYSFYKILNIVLGAV